LARIRYRVWQFWRVVWGKPDEHGLTTASEHLSPKLFNLFQQMSPAEQAHALRVLSGVRERGYEDSALLTAALLHDVGKSRCPLYPWERAWIVLANPFFAEKSEEWGHGNPSGWKRAFVVAAQHAGWGAEMAAANGASEVAVKLIREHQTASPMGFSEEEADLLAVLKQADNEN
jgi:putative nucleotidyltransferase with HDIG domain